MNPLNRGILYGTFWAWKAQVDNQNLVRNKWATSVGPSWSEDIRRRRRHLSFHVRWFFTIWILARFRLGIPRKCQEAELAELGWEIRWICRIALNILKFYASNYASNRHGNTATRQSIIVIGSPTTVLSDQVCFFLSCCPSIFTALVGCRLWTWGLFAQYWSLPFVGQQESSSMCVYMSVCVSVHIFMHMYV